MTRRACFVAGEPSEIWLRGADGDSSAPQQALWDKNPYELL